jgi:predicted NACHT family NTPase
MQGIVRHFWCDGCARDVLLCFQTVEHDDSFSLFIDPWVAGDAPLSSSSSDMWAELDAKEGHVQFSACMEEFLGSTHQVLALLGEPGSGKSTCLHHFAQRHFEGAVRHYLDTPIALLGPVECPWLPVFVNLRQYRASQLHGLVDTVLATAWGLSSHVIEALRVQGSGLRTVRLLVLCDGLDEVLLDTAVVDLATMVLRDPWPSHLLKLVVTSRPSFFSGRGADTAFLGPRDTRLILPFTLSQVRFCGAPQPVFVLLVVDGHSLQAGNVTLLP